MKQELSIGECAQSVTGTALTAKPLAWPPDVFAVVGTVLLRSGAYRAVVDEWPPRKKWNDFILSVGRRWRRAVGKREQPPKEVSEWWRFLYDARAKTFDELHLDLELAHVLLQLLAAADEASQNAGLYVGDNDAFSELALDALADSRGKTLCRTIDTSRAVVLPKLHTPQTGLTFRSLTHHLALYSAGEMRPLWHTTPRLTDLSRVLLLPWPLTIDRRAFTPSRSDVSNLPSCYGFFRYDATSATRGFDLEDVVKAVTAAKAAAGGDIDAVVFPELALREDDYVEICDKLDTIVIGGLGKRASGKLLQNHAAFGFPNNGDVLVQKQSKHHRWRLDARQVEQYGLDRRFRTFRDSHGSTYLDAVLFC